MAKKAKDVYIGTGRRKTAVARVRLTQGTGKLTVNGREFSDYHYTDYLCKLASAPLTEVEKNEKVDVVIKVVGGGAEAYGFSGDHTRNWCEGVRFRRANQCRDHIRSWAVDQIVTL